MLKEQWKPVRCYEGLYEVSNTGKVRSIDRIVCTKDGKHKKLKGKELYFTIQRLNLVSGRIQRYAAVQLWKNNKDVLKAVHRLVAEAFIPNPENKPTVNHIDGNGINNDVDNLEWATYSEQNYHAYLTGLNKPHPHKFPKNSVPVQAIHSITQEVINCGSCSELARRLGVDNARVADARDKNSKVKGYYIITRV